MLTANFSKKNLSGRPGCHIEGIRDSISTRAPQCAGDRGETTAAGPVHIRKPMYKELQVTQWTCQHHTKKQKQQHSTHTLGSNVRIPQRNQARPSRNLGQRKTLENPLKMLDSMFF